MSKVNKPKANIRKANMNNLKWPNDVWGACRPLKKAILAAAGRCAGYPDKMKVLRAVLKEGIAHIDAKDREAQLLKENKREQEAEALEAIKAAEKLAAESE